jgi:hypothetical protein
MTFSVGGSKMKKIKVSDVLSPSEVNHVETPRERIMRLLLDNIQSICALTLLLVGLVSLLIIISCVPELREDAFRTLTYLVVTAAGFFFGTNVSKQD